MTAGETAFLSRLFMEQGIMGTTTQIRFSDDGQICMVWADGRTVRVPTQHDMDTLPVGEDMTDEEVAGLDG